MEIQGKITIEFERKEVAIIALALYYSLKFWLKEHYLQQEPPNIEKWIEKNQTELNLMITMFGLSGFTPIGDMLMREFGRIFKERDQKPPS